MNDLYSLNSILNAIEDINSKSKKKSYFSSLNNTKQIEKKLSTSGEILPITEKLILEAENYSNKIEKSSSVLRPINENVLILDKEYNNQNLDILNLEEIKHNIINDLYSSLSNKIKKNTLKIIFELRQKIKNLEEEIKILNLSKINDADILNNNLKNNEEHLINEDNLEDDNEHTNDLENLDLPDFIISTLKQQNSLIKEFEKKEEKLLLNVVDLEQSIILLKKNKINTFDSNLTKNNNPSDQIISKVESELVFYKENYERLIIENNDVKKKLTNAKNQIIVFEQSIKELEDAFENLSNILSKSSIIKLKEPNT
jgi:hypothetical protein